MHHRATRLPFDKGMRPLRRYGLGRVVAVEGHGPDARAQIDFGDRVMRLVLRHAPIERL
jgi:DNA helicase-2/ATP-dependent DNA helicase PcrA